MSSAIKDRVIQEVLRRLQINTTSRPLTEQSSDFDEPARLIRVKYPRSNEPFNVQILEKRELIREIDHKQELLQQSLDDLNGLIDSINHLDSVRDSVRNEIEQLLSNYPSSSALTSVVRKSVIDNVAKIFKKYRLQSDRIAFSEILGRFEKGMLPMGDPLSAEECAELIIQTEYSTLEDEFSEFIDRFTEKYGHLANSEYGTLDSFISPVQDLIQKAGSKLEDYLPASVLKAAESSISFTDVSTGDNKPQLASYLVAAAVTALTQLKDDLQAQVQDILEIELRRAFGFGSTVALKKFLNVGKNIETQKVKLKGTTPSSTVAQYNEHYRVLGNLLEKSSHGLDETLLQNILWNLEQIQRIEREYKAPY